MAKFTRIFGVTLIFFGLIAYFGTGMVSITALIPAFFGILFVVLGIAARKEALYKHMMHGAALLALLGLIGSGRGLLTAFAMLSGQSVERPDAAISQAVMAVLCIVFLAAAVKSFVDARKGDG